MGKANPALNASRKRAKAAAVSPAAGVGGYAMPPSMVDVDALLPPKYPPGWEDYKQKDSVDILERQRTLLLGVITHGQLLGAAMEAGLADGDPARFSVEVIERWRENDQYGFRGRLFQAEEIFQSRLQMEIVNRAFDGKLGRDERRDNLPLLAALNAYVPTKFIHNRSGLAPAAGEAMEALANIGRKMNTEQDERQEAEKKKRAETALETYLAGAIEGDVE